MKIESILKIGSFFILFSAFLSGIWGILLFKSIYNDFSILSISDSVFGTFLGSAFFLTLGTWLGFAAFKRMKNS